MKENEIFYDKETGRPLFRFHKDGIEVFMYEKEEEKKETFIEKIKRFLGI